GEIEIAVEACERLAESVTPPFPVDEDTPVDELLRLRHRVVDLRREGMARNIALRHTVARAMRDYLNAHDFLEIETPMLTRSTPGPRMTYADAVARYGSDRPDLRFGLEIGDLGEALAGTDFQVFAGAEAVRGLNAGRREVTRRELDELTEHAKRFGAKGLVWA